jgi:putative ABC transport system permease protein
MRWIYKFPLRLRSLFRKSRVEQELSDELRFHLEKLAEEYVAKGITPQEARCAALRELGGVEQIKEECRDMRRVNYIESFFQDLRYGLRMLVKNRGFTLVAVLTLGLGIGANSAIFSVVDAVILRPLPYKDPNRLVMVKERIPLASPEPIPVCAPDVVQFQRQNQVFESVAAFGGGQFDLSGEGEPERITAERVNAGLFSLLGVQPVVGRPFTAEEDQPGHSLAILSYALWQRRFGANPDVLGHTVTLDRQAYTVIGVMPRSFAFPLRGMDQGEAADLFVPMAFTRDELSDIGDNFNFSVLARLKPGVTWARANADADAIAYRILQTYPPQFRDKIKLEAVALPLSGQVVGRVRTLLLLLLGAVGFVLLIACANVANLLLTRAAHRQREIAVRLAMGAGRLRLLRQLAAENLVLALAGAGLGLLLAFGIMHALVGWMPANIPRVHAIGLNLPVLAFTLGLAALTGLVFGVAPALAASRTDLNSTLKEGGRSAQQGLQHPRLRAALVVGEIALSMVLLVGAGLLVRSFERVLATQPGFRPEHVLTASLSLPEAQYKQEQQIRGFYRELIDRLKQLPGARAVGASTDLPLEAGWIHLFTPEGYQPPPGAGLNQCSHSVIIGDYLQTQGVPLLRGRYFTEQDTPGSTPVLIVSESLAKRYWPNQDPIGKRLKWGPPESNDPWLTIVGVVGDVKQGALDAATMPHTYESYGQHGIPGNSLSVAVRAEGNPASLASALRATVWGLDRELAIAQIRTMDQVISESTAPRRFNLILLVAFAALAVALAAIGIYGVISYSVAQRTHEIGIRMALGAQRGDVLRQVVGQGMLLMGAGVIIGIVGALALTRFLTSLLYEVKPTDPVTFAAVSMLVAGVALLASYFPARRATKVDPMVALRYE